jgi:hypothetical protein
MQYNNNNNIRVIDERATVVVVVGERLPFDNLFFLFIYFFFRSRPLSLRLKIA